MIKATATSRAAGRRFGSTAATALALAGLLGMMAGAMVGAIAGCKKQTATPQSPTPLADFECKERRAAYIASGGFAGAEVGVVMDCAPAGPRIHTWRLVGEDQKNTSEHSLTPDEFEEVWEKVEATGWRNLGDCDRTVPEEGEPTYKMGVKDEILAKSMTCVGKTLPFPYNRLVDTLDLVAAKYSE